MAINGNIDGRRLSSSYFPMNYAGGTIDFHRTIWPGDRIRASERVVDIHRKHSERIGDFVLCEAAIDYHNQRQELVATKTTLMARYQNLGGGRTIEYDRQKKTQVIEESPDPLVFERQRRGNAARHYEDVNEGDELPPLHKGSYTVTELFLFTHGVVGTGRSPRAALEAEESKTWAAVDATMPNTPATAATCQDNSTGDLSACAGWRRWQRIGWATTVP